MENYNNNYGDEYSKVCKECQIEFVGRLNQVFCTSKCKSLYNNRLSRFDRNATKQIDNILHKNREILRAFYESDPQATYDKKHLEQAGFNFKFQTHNFEDKKIGTCDFYYEFGLNKKQKGYQILKKELETS